MHTDLVVLRNKIACEIMECQDLELKQKYFRLMDAIDDIYFYLIKKKEEKEIIE